MSIFGSILSKIFGAAPVEAAPATAPSTPPAETTPSAPAPVPAADAPASVSSEVVAQVDIAAVLDEMNEKNPETLDWRVSIIDLLKVLGLDSSLAARKELAAELKYEGDTHDTARMNVWLHEKVIALVAANGGKVPADILKK
ncbi:DUF3597 domain-containing protein [Rhodoblastus sp.]|jgi:hypothetical protein|uniref:DUF3597 domain-containing protein n=1 Tax=Rhodoblastus sp. TaxID=1962975 RepID=UPI0026175FAA|nr:DUF3597 domain-containing protein [Rhodoblastus sp.]